MTSLTWDHYHPEVAALADTVIPWPYQRVDTMLERVSQPSLVKGPREELFVAGTQGEVFLSKDGGSTWALLCQSPTMAPDIPEGFQLKMQSTTGMGISSKGTLFVAWRQSYNDGGPYRGQRDETWHTVAWVTRSEDRGKSWKACLPLDPSPYDNIGGSVGRIHETAEERLLLPRSAGPQARPGKPIDPADLCLYELLYESTDDGRTWSRIGCLGAHTCESDLVALPSGRLLACTRYQRKKLPSDPEAFATPYYFASDHDSADCWECQQYGPTGVGGHSVYKQSAVLETDDGGKTWTAPRIVTGWHRQTGCIVRLSDGALALPFCHRAGTDTGKGQRVILSYDDGRSWSKAVYQINDFGEYASSVVLDDGTIVTAHDSTGREDHGRLHVLKWTPPPRAEVEKHGFFIPRPADIEDNVV